MVQTNESRVERAAAIELLRLLRGLGNRIGVRNSGIAFDVGLLLYEQGVTAPPGEMSVDMMAAATGYSGPTIRLVLKRLVEAGSAQAARRVGKTQLYGLTPRGILAFEAYVAALLAFRHAPDLSAGGASVPGGDPPAGP